MHWLLFVLFVVFALSQPADNPEPEVFVYDQLVDHNLVYYGANATFKQRYLVFKDYYREGGPMFFTCGGESDIYSGYRHNGLQFELAQKLGAFILYVEHRFYGQSLPNASRDVFTIAQSLQDFVDVIKEVKKKYSLSNQMPVFAWGGSYPGELALYMRIAYPDIVHAAIASGSPIKYYYGGTIPDGSYYSAVTRVFANYNPECPKIVQRAFADAKRLLETNDGASQLQSVFKWCSPLRTGQFGNFTFFVQNAFASLAMANYPWPNKAANWPSYPFRHSCNVMIQNPRMSDLEKLALSIGVNYNSTGTEQCLPNPVYPCADPTGCGDDYNGQSWDYQSCTELVPNVGTNNVTDMFPLNPFNFSQLTSYCLQTYGKTPQPTKIHTTYDLKASSRYIISNGLLDPWWTGGEYECDQYKEAHCFLIPESAHHLDFYGYDPVHDPLSVVDVRNQISRIITEWTATIKEELSAKN